MQPDFFQVSATQKRMDRQKQEADRLATNWYDRAQLALQNGDEDLAREALARRQQQVRYDIDVADADGLVAVCAVRSKEGSQ